MRKLIVVFIIVFILGINVGRWIHHPENIWPEERGGIQRLNQMMKDDHTERLAVIALTQKQDYLISALPQEYRIALRLEKR